jgi:putative oxidoreductase
LIILRLAVAVFLIHGALAPLAAGSNTVAAVPPILAAAGGVLLLIGLWTPAAGVLAALLELWIAFSRSSEFWTSALAAAIAWGLAMLGPGAWSIDALVYGRKRISIRDR